MPRTLCVSGIRLAAVPAAVGLSREFVRRTLQHWQLEEQVDSAELIASELVTNAVKTTGGCQPPPEGSQTGAHHVIGVRLRLAGTSLYVEVWDAGDGSPVVPRQHPEAEGGRGLLLVEVLSKRWDVYRPRHGGKVVWSELALSAPGNPTGSTGPA